MDIILASSSPYRRKLLQRLAIPFRCISPQIDESPLQNESPGAVVERLAMEKAATVAKAHPDALVIGSDQLATLDGRLLGKPGSHEAAVAQLKACSGRTVTFYTALCLTRAEQDLSLTHTEPFVVEFRALSAGEIDRYLKLEQPYDCAGSFKCEGLGIALFERLTGDDPTSLEGLPLIALTQLLSKAGVSVLGR